jgi:8-oxo-dGTP pyrophosphatase MutT (NUDIX family)
LLRCLRFYRLVVYRVRVCSQSAEDVLVAPPAVGSVLRPTVRVLLIDESGQVLLLRAAASTGGPQVWFVVGGGIDAGEEARAAAQREVREETGLADAAIGPEVWRRRQVLAVDGVLWDLRERWYVASVASFTPDRAGFTPWERARVTELRWWSIPALIHTTERVSPLDLGHLLGALMHDGPPPNPVLIET